MRRPTVVRENCGTLRTATMASLPLLELDLPSVELLDSSILLEDFTSLELDLASLLEDLALLEDDATLELDATELDDASELDEATELLDTSFSKLTVIVRSLLI